MYGPLDLLVIQSSPYCNLDCKYCYLPNRKSKKIISLETVTNIYKKIFESDIVKSNFTTTWHAGEPLATSKKFYTEAFQIADSLNNTEFKIKHNFQTNGTLITQEWCDFIKDNNVNISVSIDGPDFLHNINRKNLKGNDTFNEVIRGIELLNKNSIEFSTISVISSETLKFPNEFYSFFKTIKPKFVGLNIEEVENFNLSSTLFNEKNYREKFKAFIEALFNLYYTDKDKHFILREFYQLENFVLSDNKYLNGIGQQTIPFRILAIDSQGNFSTFSPELLDAKSREYVDFKFGNVNNDSPLIECLETNKFKEIFSEILNGIHLCKEKCQYFSVCGGGTPSNKYSENGTFFSTETNHCKLKFQDLFDVFYKGVKKALD